MRSNFQQNPRRLREVDLEPSHKRGSDKINMQKQGRNTQRKQVVLSSLDPHMDPSTYRDRLGTQY